MRQATPMYTRYLHVECSQSAGAAVVSPIVPSEMNVPGSEFIHSRFLSYLSISTISVKAARAAASSSRPPDWPDWARARRAYEQVWVCDESMAATLTQDADQTCLADGATV